MKVFLFLLVEETFCGIRKLLMRFESGRGHTAENDPKLIKILPRFNSLTAMPSKCKISGGLANRTNAIATFNNITSRCVSLIMPIFGITSSARTRNNVKHSY